MKWSVSICLTKVCILDIFTLSEKLSVLIKFYIACSDYLIENLLIDGQVVGVEIEKYEVYYIDTLALLLFKHNTQQPVLKIQCHE